MRAVWLAVVLCSVALGCGKKSPDSEAKKDPKEKAASEQRVPPAATGQEGSTEAPKPPTGPAHSVPGTAPPELEGAPVQPDPDYRFVALTQITGDKEVLELIERLAKPVTSTKVRKKFERLGKDRVVAPLLAAMSAPVPNIRGQAAQVLQRMDHKSEAFSRRLSQMILSDPDPDVRGMIARVMVFHRDRANTPALEKVLLADKTEAVRVHAAWALGASHDPAGIEALTTALRDKSTDVRLRAVGGLKRTRAKSKVPEILALLEAEKNPMVTVRALETLVKFGVSVSVNGRKAGSPRALEKMTKIGRTEKNTIVVRHRGTKIERNLTVVVWPGD